MPRTSDDIGRDDKANYHTIGSGKTKQKKRCCKSSYPTSVYFILANEVCERFSFYGMKAVLYLYLNEYLHFSKENSYSIYHAFILIAYLFPILGGVLSDAYLGKYRTILYLSIVYALGSIAMSVTAIPGITGNPPHWWGITIGLPLIAFGTGGIKPCVSAFGGDQFTVDQEDMLATFFNFFYLSINIGSVASIFLTPLLRIHVGYYASFGVPAVLLIIATICFFAGRNSYKHVPPGTNAIGTVFRVIRFAIAEMWRMRRVKNIAVSHWLDRAEARFSKETIVEVKSVLAVIWVLIPLPIFWALFDQSGSTWVEQAKEMDLSVGKWKIAPDQTGTLNPLCVLFLVPLFDRIVYPFLTKKLKIQMRPLRRMKIGMIFTAISFAIAGGLQMFIDKNPGKVSVAWQIPQNVIMTTGEVMISISGLEFSYSQAPKSMKSVIMSMWLLTVAIGNAVVILVVKSTPLKLAYSFFLFGGLMLVFFGIFLLITRNYRYVETDLTKEDKRALLAEQRREEEQ
eukprot:TRINITY_DN4682_c0_g1_i1.p1 TRINITY_DN4682_c0_g1~~TRINITY_DN4682_c0_g1_i1.p1  ORF type:complete len:512 (+),score=76.92 TRINITY_DN4682_c0_g1_i1:149-1684(+)